MEVFGLVWLMGWMFWCGIFDEHTIEDDCGAWWVIMQCVLMFLNWPYYLGGWLYQHLKGKQ